MAIKYKRILLKLSGEALQGTANFGIDFNVVSAICSSIKEAHQAGVEIGIVIGGGNIFRGGNAKNMNRVDADHMGMLATVINGLALQNTLEHIGLQSVIMSAVNVHSICQPYICRKALSYLAKGIVMVFAGGSGNPFFTTDTAACLRAAELNCDVILKATKADGVYSADPRKNENADFYSTISYREVISKKLKVMDTTAVALAEESNIPIIVFSIYDPQNLNKVLHGEGHFTTIS